MNPNIRIRMMFCGGCGKGQQIPTLRDYVFMFENGEQFINTRWKYYRVSGKLVPLCEDCFNIKDIIE